MIVFYLHCDATVDELIDAAAARIGDEHRDMFLVRAAEVRSSFSATRSLATDFGVSFIPRGLRSDHSGSERKTNR